jgi:hypothetical protein
MNDYGLSIQEQDRREHQREFEQANAWSNEDEIKEIIDANIHQYDHPLDIRNDPSMRDPALVDLTAAKAQAHRDRIDADERAAELKRERLREIYGEQMQAAPTQEAHDPEKIMRTSSAEQALKALCGNSYAA